MNPPKNMFVAESFRQMKKTATVLRSSLEKNCYLPGHNEVSKADLLPRERPGTFPFDMEDKGFNSTFQSLLLLIHPALRIWGRQIQSSNR
jgi:hypothetical protein